MEFNVVIAKRMALHAIFVLLSSLSVATLMSWNVEWYAHKANRNAGTLDVFEFSSGRVSIVHFSDVRIDDAMALDVAVWKSPSRPSWQSVRNFVEVVANETRVVTPWSKYAYFETGSGIVKKNPPGYYVDVSGSRVTVRRVAVHPLAIVWLICAVRMMILRRRRAAHRRKEGAEHLSAGRV